MRLVKSEILIENIFRYAAAYVPRILRPHSRARKWIPTNLNEMKGFLAVLLNMGIVKLPSISDYWATKYAAMEVPWFR